MEDRCVCCGAVVPEGWMVCPICAARETPKDQSAHKQSQGKGLAILFQRLGHIVCKKAASRAKEKDRTANK